MSSLEQRISTIIGRYLGEILTKSIIRLSVTWSNADISSLTEQDSKNLLTELTKGVRLYVQGEDQQRECLSEISELLAGSHNASPSAEDRVTIPISQESDIVVARVTGREMCRKLGFTQADQIKVATAISELARNIVQYAGSGQIGITTLPTSPPGLEIVASDQGPGIALLGVVMSNNYKSREGMGIGLKAVKKLMDEFEIQSEPGTGTVVTARKSRR